MQWLINQLTGFLLRHTIKKVSTVAFEEALLKCGFKRTRHNKPDGFLYVYEKNVHLGYFQTERRMKMQWLINQLTGFLLRHTIKKVGTVAFEEALLKCGFKRTRHNKPDGFLHVYEKEGARVTIAESGGLQEG